MPVTKAQTAAKVKYERTAYDKILLRIEKETDEPAEASADGQEKEDKRRRRKGRNQDMPTKGQIEQAAKAANETLNGYILKAVKQRMERDGQPHINADPPTPAAKPDMDAIRRQIASMTGFDSKPKHEPTAFSNDPGDNDFG